jgi:hypothetical protein
MRYLLIAGFAATTACGGTNAKQSDSAPVPDRQATVLRGSDLAGGSLLDVLRTRVAGITVRTQDQACPLVSFRGTRSVRNQGAPTIYVDKTLMADTCILQQMSTTEVERVEVFPSGITSLPSIQRNANGVIMIYRIRN